MVCTWPQWLALQAPKNLRRKLYKQKVRLRKLIKK